MSGSYEALPESDFLDLTGFRTGAALPRGSGLVDQATLNVALVLERAQDPTALLSADWATRQRSLARMEDDGTLWQKFGADPTAYAAVVDALGGMGIPVLGLSVGGAPVTPGAYLSSVESRTIWVQLTETSFPHLFGPGAVLRWGTTQNQLPTQFWEGPLSLPTGWQALGVKGIWFDERGYFRIGLPVSQTEVGVTLPNGAQSPGNVSTARDILPPQTIAGAHYDFPLQGRLWDPASGGAVPTGPIGLIEPGIGTAMPEGASFDAALRAYREGIGITGPTHWRSIAPGGQSYPNGDWNTERSLDVGVVTAVNPQSRLLIYAGSGTADGAQSNPFTAFHQAFWDDANRPGVITTSFGVTPETTPGSPFAVALDGLFADAALRRTALFYFAGDGGSSNQLMNGSTNVFWNQTGPYAVIIGGTALSSLRSADADPTLAALVAAALAGDRALLWQLMSGGLTSLPRSGATDADTLVETVWNKYIVDNAQGTIDNLDGSGGYLHNNTGSGGVDPTHAQPDYQAAYGLARLGGRGVPDLAALAGGNMRYVVPDGSMRDTIDGGGTSASTPLMAAFASQVDAVFADQGLPNLGYHTDLYYIAAAILPGAFNDITLGNNTSSGLFSHAGRYHSDGRQIAATGIGFAATADYDLVSGLGSPNGLLLARAMAAIAHRQWSHADNAAPLGMDAGGSWQGGAAQSLLVQTVLAVPARVTVQTGDAVETLDAPATAGFGWTPRLASQVLQPDFDPALVTLFDGDAQGALSLIETAPGDDLAVSVDNLPAEAFRATLTSPYGFADFRMGEGAADAIVRLARPVAVAETAGGADDQVAVVRMRQNGTLDSQVLFYRVDDLGGGIDGLAPGAAGYDAASFARAYLTTEGAAWIAGAGWGRYAEALLAGIDAGDLVAMRLRAGGEDFRAFAEANERDAAGRPVGHLWHYALNIWGWEDLPGGGDRDFNDLVVQIDFTSAAGHGWLA